MLRMYFIPSSTTEQYTCLSQDTVLSLKLCLLSHKIIEGSLVFLALVSVFIQLVLQSPAQFLQVSL